MASTWRQALLAALLLAAAAPVRAAGGHFWVDDAAMLEPGQCQLETWAEREQGGARRLAHAGPACRVGPVEAGISWDRARNTGAGSVTTVSPQLKWAHALDAHWSAGLVYTGTWQTGGAGYQGSTLLVPVTWHPTEQLHVHLNLGRDFHRDAAGSTRAGAALEWAATQQLSLVAERFRENQADAWRLGARWSPHAHWSVDLSRAAPLRSAVPAWWTLGLNLSFGH
jgi:hypothetical protein